MNMKNSLPPNQNVLHSVPTEYNNEEFSNINVNSNENFLKPDLQKVTMNANYIPQNLKVGPIQEGCSQNNDMSKFIPILSPYYNYKPNGNGMDQDQMNMMGNQEYQNVMQPMMTNGYTTSSICPTTGYETIPMAANTAYQCNCAYCVAVYQNQWYLNYYGTMQQNPYVLAPPPDPNSQIGKPFEHTYRPIVLMKPSDMMFNQESQEIDQKLAHLTPVYINQPVPSNTEHFQRRTPFKKRDHNALSWLLLYLELEKDVDSPTMNARIAWINDMHHIIYTKLTSGIISRWQYEYEFSHLKNIITQKSIEADEIFKMLPKLCHCGERFKSENELNDHSNHCTELKVPWHRCLCGKLFDQHFEFFQHIFSGIIHCPMAVYHLWIFFEKYRRRRYKCFCSVIFHNFWVYYIHMGECIEYLNYFQRNCYFCQDSMKKAIENNSFWSYPMVGPMKDLVRQSKIQ